MDQAQQFSSPQNVASKQPQDLIRIEHLKKFFPVRGGLLQRTKDWVKAVDDVSFTIQRGECLGLVGESGCGKTTVGRSLLRLIEPSDGHVFLDDRDVCTLRGGELKDLRRRMQIIFQDPYASLDPRLPVGESVMEGLEIHRVGTHQERYEIMLEYLRKVGLEEYHSRRYPHEFSGGQRQRIGIARALAVKPDFVICDEPVSALDVSIQSQVLNILRDLQQSLELTYLFIAHNLSVVEHISSRVAVMYLGKLVELASREDLFLEPLHPYTQALISAIPLPDPKIKRSRVILKGDVPSPLRPPSGCRFHPRCPVVRPECSQQEPEFREVKPGHFVACLFAG